MSTEEKRLSQVEQAIAAMSGIPGSIDKLDSKIETMDGKLDDLLSHDGPLIRLKNGITEAKQDAANALMVASQVDQRLTDCRRSHKVRGPDSGRVSTVEPGPAANPGPAGSRWSSFREVPAKVWVLAGFGVGVGLGFVLLFGAEAIEMLKGWLLVTQTGGP